MATVSTAVEGRRSEWFESWFDSAHYHRLYANRDESEATAFIDRLLARLTPEPGVAMLDLGCGSGRHARSLAARGYEVTGLDLSAGSLSRARAGGGPPVRFIEQDMRQPFGTAAFDFVFSLFTSFGYFEDAADHATVIGNIARALNPGGTLVLDYLNAEHVQRHLVASEVVRRDGIGYTLTRWSTREAFFKRIGIDDPSLPAPLEYQERVARLGLSDFQKLLTAAGLRIELVFGDYALSSFEVETSPRLIVVAGRSTTR